MGLRLPARARRAGAGPARPPPSAAAAARGLRVWAVAAALLPMALAAGACEDSSQGFDPFPVQFDDSSGAVVLAASVGNGAVPAVVNTLSPVSIVDPFQPGEALPPPARRNLSLILLGLDAGGQPTIPRARFDNTSVLEIHPCGGDQACLIGLGDDALPVGAVIGYDILARGALRIDFADRQLRMFPRTPGTDAELTDDCEAVVGNVFAGGGTLEVAGTEVPYPGRRPVLGACLDAADPPEDQEHGTDALLVVSTGIGPSVLAASAYQRYAAASGAPALADLPQAELHLSSTTSTVRLAEIGRLALVGHLTQDNQTQDRGPCRELYLNRLMAEGGCGGGTDGGPAPASCPCPNGDSFCRTAAAIDRLGPVQVAVVNDDDPALQALRDELRPDRAELDGILGGAALAPLRMELDYPSNRVVLRCRGGGSCLTRPQVRSRSSLASLATCLARGGGDLPDAGPGDGGGGGDGDGGGAGDGGAAADAGP